MCQDLWLLVGVSCMCTNIFVTQAWAFATQARKLMGQTKHMNMLAFDYRIWTLHRRLFHRFLKFQRSIRHATEDLTDFDEEDPDTAAGDEDATDKVVQKSIRCLLSSDSEEGYVSEEGEHSNESSEYD